MHRTGPDLIAYTRPVLILTRDDDDRLRLTTDSALLGSELADAIQTDPGRAPATRDAVSGELREIIRQLTYDGIPVEEYAIARAAVRAAGYGLAWNRYSRHEFVTLAVTLRRTSVRMFVPSNN